jgi:hypothetical protein
MLNVVNKLSIPSVIMLSVANEPFMLSVIILNVIMQNVIVLNVANEPFMLCVIILMSLCLVSLS